MTSGERDSTAQEKWRAWPPSYCVSMAQGVFSMTCPGPQVIQTCANGGTRQVPPLWLQIHVPAMKHLMQYPAPQCRKGLSDWRHPSSKDVQTVKHTRKLFCIGARRFHIAYFNFTWLFGPRQTCYFLHDSHGSIYHITVTSLNLQVICSFWGKGKKRFVWATQWHEGK